MADRVELAFRKAAARLLPPSGKLLAAVSGGGDSVAMLDLLQRYAARQDRDVIVAHLDHGVRRGSGSDRRFVERLAAERGVPAMTDLRRVEDLRRRDESPEEAARRVRRSFLLECARVCGANAIVTGHTQDDQAETVLMRLLRGAGPSALAGMAEAGPGPFVRPLLGVERTDIRAYLARRGLRFREDPTNRNLRYDRNRLRLRVLPFLEAHANPRSARNLVRAADLLREDAALLDGLAAARYARLAERTRRGTVVLDARRLAATPAPLSRRIARLALRDAGIPPRRVSARHVGAVLDLAAGPGGRRIDLPSGASAVRRRDRVRIVPGPRPS